MNWTWMSFIVRHDWYYCLKHTSTNLQHFAPTFQTYLGCGTTQSWRMFTNPNYCSIWICFPCPSLHCMQQTLLLEEIQPILCSVELVKKEHMKCLPVFPLVKHCLVIPFGLLPGFHSWAQVCSSQKLGLSAYVVSGPTWPRRAGKTTYSNRVAEVF